MGRGGEGRAGLGQGWAGWTGQSSGFQEAVPLPRACPLRPGDCGRQGARRPGCMGLPRARLFWLLLLLVASCSGILFVLLSSVGKPLPGPQSGAR